MSEQLTLAAEAAIERVGKILAQARSEAAIGNEAAAQNAMDMAHRILEQHNLDMALVERKAGEKTHAKREDKSSGGGLYKWQREVWENTAKLNMCVYFSIKGLTKGQKYENRLVGKPENVLMTRLMAEYLQDAIERIAAQWAKDQGYQSRFVRDAIIYREGMAERIGERLRDLRAERLREMARKAAEAAANPTAGSTGTSLILASVIQTEEDYNNDYLNGWEPGTTAQARAEREARMAAYADKRKKFEEQRVAYKAGGLDALKAFFALAEDFEDALKAQKAEDKREADWQLYSAGKWSETYGKGYKEPRPSRSMGVRRENEQDRRRSSYAFNEGYYKGDSVGLDKQIDEKSVRRIK